VSVNGASVKAAFVSISSDEAAWLRLCHYALCERDPFKLVERITEARSAVLDQLAFPNVPSAERAALHEALEMLVALREIAERDLELSANARTSLGNLRQTTA
jgi:hypothetical protein